MKIVFGIDRSRADAHAAKVVAKLRDKELDPGYGITTAIGVSAHQARFPQTCDDCDETFWAADPWGHHRGCKARMKGGVGFNG